MSGFNQSTPQRSPRFPRLATKDGARVKARAPRRPAARAPIVRAALTPAVSAMILEGRGGKAELAKIEAVCLSLPSFEGETRETLRAVIGAIVGEIDALGHEMAMVRALRVLSPELRKSAFRFAAEYAPTGFQKTLKLFAQNPHPTAA